MRDSNEGTPPLKNDGRGLFRPALRTNDTERFEQNVQGGRLVRGLVGVMTFAPTLSFLGNLFVSLTALGTGILATGAILGEESEAQCTTWGAFTVTGTCTGTQTGTVDHVSGNQTFNRDLNLSSNFTINNSSSGSNDHGFIVGKSGTGGTSQGGHITITQLGTASDSFTISAAGRAVWLKANITNTSVGTTTLTLIRGIQSRKNVGAFVDGYGGHVSATFRTVSGKTGGIHARHRASTAGQNMTITATRSVTTESGPGVYAKKDTSGNLTLSLSAVTGGSATTSTSSIGVHVIHTGSSGSATVTVTGTTQAGKYGLKANLTSNGNHNIKMATITSSGHGAHISGTRQLTFSSTGNITASAGHGFYLNRGDGTSTGNLRLNFKDVSATQDGIHIYSNTASATTITTNGNVKSTSSGFNGIYVNNLGSGNITLTISGGYQKVIQGGGKRNASPGPPSVSEKLGYALNVNSVTSGSATSGTGTVTITITGGVTVSGTTSAGAILNGDGNSSILFRGFYTNLNGNVKLGKGEDKLVFSSGIKIAANVELDGGQEAANSTLTDEVTFDRAYSILSNVRGISINVLTVDPNNLKNWERVNLKQSTVWRVTGTKTLTTKNFYLGGILTLEEATNARPDDSLTIAGNLVGEGNQSQIQLNVNFDAGTADTLTVTGNVTGVIPINVVNVSPSGSASNIPNDISIVTVQGTTASTAFSVHRLSQHLPINANLVFNSTTKTFYFEAVHVPLCVTPTGGSSGTFVCSGTLDFPEVMIATGTTSIVATLNSASTTVSSSEAGFLFTLRGKNGITFTQSTGGGTLTADGSATGVIDVLNSGNGNVEVTLIGSASLAGSGTAVKVASTGTGTVTVSANNITASHSQAKAVQLEGAGTRVLLDAKGTVAGGIEIKNTHSTGTATVSASATVTNGTGTAIYAYGKGNLVEVKTSNTVTGSATGSNAVGGIKVVNKSSGSGAIKISVGGTLTSSGGIGIHAENDGTGALTITAATVSASNSTPINVVNRNSGDITLNISGQVTGSSSTSAGEGIKIADSGSGDIEINTASVTGGAHGILVEKNNTGSIEITISGDVTGRGTSNREYGISVKSNASAGDITLNLSNHKVTGGYAINIYGKPSAETTITSSGEIEGKGGGIYFYSDQSATLDFDLHTVTASSVRGISIQAYGGVSASIDVASGGKIEAKTYGIVVNSDGTGSIEVDASGAITAEDSIGLWIDHAGNGAVTLSTVSVTGGKQGILIQKEGTGNVTLTSTGTIESDSDLDGVHSTVTGAGNVSLTVSAVTGDKMGVFAKNVGAGTITINANGAITASGTGTKDAGIYAITNTSGDKIEINVNSSGTVSGKFGIYTESESSSNLEITTSGAVTGTGEDGISAKLTSGTLTIKISGNVTGASSKVGIETQTNASGNSIITVYSGTVTSSGGNAITNNGGSSTVTIHSVARVTAGISLGAGVDVLTFSGGVISPDYTIDGGEDTGTDTSTDELSINSISALLNASMLTNWEVISFGTGTTGRFDGTVTLATDEFRVPNGTTLSLKDEVPGDTLTVGGDFSGGGTIELDVNLATGAKDSIVVQGDISGVTKIKINNKTPSNASGRQETIQIVSLTGTSTSNALSLDGSLRSQGYSYSIELDSTGKIFNLVGTRTNLLCVENTNTTGTFACSGTINTSESMIKSGTTNIVTTVANDATVSVSGFVAFYMLGANAITFTQAANGGTINGIGNATGAIKAKTTGNGNVQITLTGTATLAGSGTVVAAESAGTGNISVTTQKITASNSSARGIFADGRAAITINANDEVTGGIEIKTRANGGKVTVNASSTVSSNNNDGIHVKRQAGGGGSSASIEINATGAVTGSRHGIYVNDDNVNSRSGTLTITVTGAVTATNNRGISVDLNYGSGIPISITVNGAIRAKRRGIFAWNKGTGNVVISANNTVNSEDSDGIWAYATGDNINIKTTSAVSGGLFGIGIEHRIAGSNGTVSVTASGTVTGNGRAGIYLKGNRNATSLSATVAAVTGKEIGIRVYNVSAVNLSANGSVTGTEKDGVNIEGRGSTVTVNFSSTVSGGQSGIVLRNSGDGAGTLLLDASGTVSGTANDGINVINNRVGATTVTAASTVTGSTSGITAKGTGSGTSAVLVSAVGAISATAGTGIYAYGKGASVTVTASTTVTGSASSGAVGGIKAVNKSTGAGTVSVKAGGKITTTGGSGIHVENESTGGITISAGEIETSGSGVVAENSNSGALLLNLTGTITTVAGSGGDGVKATSHGADDIEVNTVSVTGDADGIDLNKTGGGSITLTISGAITSRGDDNDQAAIAAINDSEGDDIKITLSNHAITGGYHGLYVYNEGDGKITITSTGTITGNGKHGIYVNQEGSSVDLSVHTVRGEEYGIDLKHYGDSTAEVTVASGGSIVGGETGINVYAKSDSDITLEASGTIRGRNSDGLYVYHSGDGNVTLSVASVSGKSDGIDLRKYGSGNATLTATGKVETANNSEQDGIEALSSGAGNISISVGAVTGDEDGIDVRNYVGGTIALNVTGAIVSNGTSSSDTGIYAYADEDAGNITLSVGSAGSVTGRFGVTASSKSSGNITINTSGSITGTAESGIFGEIAYGELSITVSGNVTGSSSKVAIDTKSDASGTTKIVINNGIITASGGTAIQNDGGASDITINSGATINEKISLGGGVDKLAFVGKAPDSTIELDGGNDTGTDTSVDVLTFSGFTASVSAAQLKNWENVVVASGTTINFEGTQNLVAKTLTLSGGVVSLRDDSVDDSLTITGSVGSSGSLGIDVNLSTGSADTITVTGNLTGTHKLIINDITRTNEIARVTSVKVVSVDGTSSSRSLTLQNRFKSGGFAYDLEYNASQQAFYLIGIRSTINCLESDVNPGNYTCSGNFALTENILGDGTGNLVVVLDASAIVNVGASVAMSLEGAGSITFTQATGGDSINATGSATGVIHAKTSGSGAINITLTGTANLVSEGTAILVDSTGTGAITVTTSRVTANDRGATAINLMGSGDSIQLNTQSAVSGGRAGIIVKNVNSTGTVTVSASADIESISGTAIYAYGKGESVTVSTGGQASGNALGIKAVNKSAGSGSLTITAGNSVKGTRNTGIYASNSGAGGLAVTAGAVTGGKAGIDARNYTAGNLTINVTGTVSVTGTANDDGINSYNKGSGNVTVSTVAVTGAASGVDIRNYGGGVIKASFNGAVIATGTSTGDAGVVLINDAQGGDVTATIIAGSSVTGQHGIRGEHHGSGAFLVNASGAISGRTEDGINIKGGTAGSITLNVNEVSAAKRAFHITNTGAGSVAITATGTVKTNANVTPVTAVSVINSGSTTLTLSTVQATRTGVYVSSTGQGSSTITLNGAVSATGSLAVHGVYAKAGDRAGNIVINVPTGGSVTGRTTAIKAMSSGSGSVTIVTSANLAASKGGIHAQVEERGNISLNITGDITLSGSESVAIDTSSRSGTTTIIIGGGTIGGKTSIKNNEGDSTVTVNKGVELDGNVELGGGVDKIIFNESFGASVTIDGGTDTGIDRSKDVLAIESGSATIDISKIKNWEILQVGAAGTVTINGTSTLTFEQVMLAGTLSLKNDSTGDALTLSGELAPHGTNNIGALEVDVDFSSGDSDTISISGNISGSHNLTLVDVTPSDETDRFLTRINVVTVEGTATESNLSLTGTRFASGGYLYKINFDNQTRTYYLTGERGTLNCGSSSEGVYSCSGAIIFPENIRTIGDTAVVATLATGATVNVTTDIAIYMTSENSISFTQATGGQPINASGVANGVVLASNTGQGNVSVTLTGTANLEGAGIGVTARSTGTGNVSVTTASVVANHGLATAIRADGRGELVSVNATAVSAGRNGIIATNRSNNGATSVVTTGTVTSSGNGIYAFSLSGNVNVNAASVSGGVSAIVAKNDGGTGNVSVTTGGLVTGSGTAIQAYNYGTGTLNVRVTNSVTGLGSDAINVVAGADTTSITVSAMNSTGRRNAIRVENKGTATANVNVFGNTIGNRGSAIHVENDGSGAINIIASSRISGGNQGTGIETRTKGGATKITLNAGAAVSGASGIAIRNDEGASEVAVEAGASVSGRVLLGGGVDRLTFANATFGNSILDGGTDTGADVSVDVLTINGGSFKLSEDSFLNWERIAFGPQTNITVDGVTGLNTNSLTVQGTLSMQDDVANDTFTIDGNLVGGGIIKIDADFFTGNHDELIVSGNVTGRTTIEVKDISPSTGGRDQESMEIITVTGSSTTVSFSLLNGGFTTGAYQYELEFLPATKTYALSKKQSVGSVMLVAAPITLLDSFAKLPRLHERRSIDSTQSNWTRVIGNTNSYGKAAAGQAEYESQTTGLQAGFDFAKRTTPTGTWVYGVTAQFNSMDTDIKIATTEGELMAEGYGVGATATWIGLNGAYLDIQAQYNQMTIDFLVAGSGTTFIDGQDSTAMAISMELGKRHGIGDNLTFLTNGQVSWGLADIGDVKSSSGQPILFGDDANITARFGMRLEYDEEPYKLHVLANVYYDTLESWEATFANATYTDSKDPVSLELGLGGSMKLSPNSNLFMQGGFRKTTDDDYEQRDSAHFTTGVRWSW